MGHTCKAFIVHCMDFRFGDALFGYLKEQHLLCDGDIVGWAGSAKAFLDDETKAFAIRQLELSHDLHKTEEVHLIQHVDCGAYGGSASFSSHDEEVAFQKDQFHKAAQIINAKYPNIRVVGHVAELTGNTTARFSQISD